MGVYPHWIQDKQCTHTWLFILLLHSQQLELSRCSYSRELELINSGIARSKNLSNLTDEGFSNSGDPYSFRSFLMIAFQVQLPCWAVAIKSVLLCILKPLSKISNPCTKWSLFYLVNLINKLTKDHSC